MKALMRTMLVLGVLFLPGADLLAQATTITLQDVQGFLAQGGTLTRKTDSVTTRINIGTLGASVFDFSGLAANATYQFQGASPAGAPAQFTGATHVQQLQGTTTLVTPFGTFTMTGTFYYQLTGPHALYTGFYANVTSPLTGYVPWTSTPADTLYALPMTLGTTWSSTYTEAATGYAGVLTIPITNRVHAVTNTVDAYGLMTLPGGITHDALRIRKVDHITDNATAPPKFKTEISYTFLAKDGARVRLTAIDTAQADTGFINVVFPNSAIEYDIPPISNDVPVASALPVEYALQQNYPNPFNPSTTIRYTVPEKGLVKLAVYNMLGQQVAQLVVGERARGTYEARFDASSFPSGTYFYRLEAGSFVATKRMTLVK